MPAYNPGEVIIDVVERTRRYAAAIVIVDDGCNADNRAYLERCSHHPDVSLLTHADNRGKGFALMTGIECCLIGPGSVEAAGIDARQGSDPPS